MKYLLHLGFFVLLSSFGMAGELFARREVGAGNDSKLESDVYLARTPYTLHWNIQEETGGYRHKFSAQKYQATTVALRVYEVGTERLIATIPGDKLEGYITIPKSGRYYIRVFKGKNWRCWISEDEKALQIAQREGRLEPGKTLEEAAANKNSVTEVASQTQDARGAARAKSEEELRRAMEAEAERKAQPQMQAPVVTPKPQGDPGLPPGMQRAKP